MSLGHVVRRPRPLRHAEDKGFFVAAVKMHFVRWHHQTRRGRVLMRMVPNACRQRQQVAEALTATSLRPSNKV
jgi:hypothetical protein